MALTFNLLLRDAGIDPDDVRLLRHETRKHRGRTPYSIWRRDPALLERYQSTQERTGRSYFASRYWAAFVVSPNGRTVFVGLYEVHGVMPVPEGWTHPLNDAPLDPATEDLYQLTDTGLLREYGGRLVIDWGAAARSWRQIASRQDKPIVELRERTIDPPYPGHAALVLQLSDVEALPLGWRAVLAHTGGVYLLTCPKTREQYVGSATGEEGFLSRWLQYARDGHGGNIALRSRDPENYRISILQVAGSDDDRATVEHLEALWKTKLQSREMGLNRN